MDSLRRRTKKLLIEVTGGLVVLIGIVLIPYPGPGWLTVFAGLAILSSEFAFATKLLAYGRKKYEAWTQWLKKQPWGVKILVLSFTVAVVIVTLWLLNTFGFVVRFLHLSYPWLSSPFFSR